MRLISTRALSRLDDEHDLIHDDEDLSVVNILHLLTNSGTVQRHELLPCHLH